MDFINTIDRPKTEIVINKVFIYKVNDKSMTARDKMDLNTRLTSFITEKDIEVLGTFEDDIRIPPQKREGIKKITHDYKQYFDDNFDRENILETIGIKILIANSIPKLGINLHEQLEVIELLGQDYASLYFVPGA